jgi:hypothetical protein
VSAVDARIQVLEQPHLLATPAVAVVRREREEIERVVDRDRPREIGDEDDRRLQRGDEYRLEPVVVGSDLSPELRDSGLDLRGGEVDVSDTLVERIV